MLYPHFLNFFFLIFGHIVAPTFLWVKKCLGFGVQTTSPVTQISRQRRHEKSLNYQNVKLFNDIIYGIVFLISSFRLFLGGWGGC